MRLVVFVFLVLSSTTAFAEPVFQEGEVLDSWHSFKACAAQCESCEEIDGEPSACDEAALKRSLLCWKDCSDIYRDHLEDALFDQWNSFF